MNQRLLLTATGFVALLLPVSCGAGSGTSSSSAMVLEEANHGFGRLLPYTTFVPDAAGLPTAAKMEIRSFDDLLNSVSADNPILPIEPWPATAVLPSGQPGNQYIHDGTSRASTTFATSSSPRGPTTI
jgi:hypothetical protein